MKKLYKCLIFISLFLFTNTKILALSVSKDNLTLDPGKSENIQLYANSDKEIVKVDFTLVYSTYDIPANFNVTDGNKDTMVSGVRHSVSLGDGKTGKVLLGNIEVSVVASPNIKNGSVNISNVVAKTKDGEDINLKNAFVNVNVKEVKKEIDKNMLDRIESKIVDIKLEKDKFDYEVTVDYDLVELDLKAIAKDNNTKIDITTQKIADIKDNKIIITTKLEDTEQIYTIKVNVKEKPKEEINITVDDSEFKSDNTYKLKWIIMATLLAGSIVISLMFLSNTEKKKRRKKKRLM